MTKWKKAYDEVIVTTVIFSTAYLLGLIGGAAD